MNNTQPRYTRKIAKKNLYITIFSRWNCRFFWFVSTGHGEGGGEFKRSSTRCRRRRYLSTRHPRSPETELDLFGNPFACIGVHQFKIGRHNFQISKLVTEYINRKCENETAKNHKLIGNLLHADCRWKYEGLSAISIDDPYSQNKNSNKANIEGWPRQEISSIKTIYVSFVHNDVFFHNRYHEPCYLSGFLDTSHDINLNWRNS